MLKLIAGGNDYTLIGHVYCWDIHVKCNTDLLLKTIANAAPFLPSCGAVTSQTATCKLCGFKTEMQDKDDL